MVVILSEDHAVPQVVVNVTYGVGSRMERPGRTGFAHLFEHLMFMGTRRAPTKAFDAWMEEAGGRNNAWTAEDRTDYFDIAPSTALPLLLWLEADRMRDLGPLIDQSKLDLQRDVVRNERRQSIENRPYGGRGARRCRRSCGPTRPPVPSPRHRLARGPRGRERRRREAVLRHLVRPVERVARRRRRLRSRSRPRRSIEKNFGSIPSQGKPADPGAPGFSDEKTTLTGVVRETIPDNVELDEGHGGLAVAAALRPGRRRARSARERPRSGQGEPAVQGARVRAEDRAGGLGAGRSRASSGRTSSSTRSSRPGVDPAKVEKALLEQVAKVRDKEVTTEELERARNTYEMEFVDRLQGVEERASLLNMYQAETGDPGFVQQDLDRYRHATREGPARVREEGAPRPTPSWS